MTLPFKVDSIKSQVSQSKTKKKSYGTLRKHKEISRKDKSDQRNVCSVRTYIRPHSLKSYVMVQWTSPNTRSGKGTNHCRN